MSQVLNYSRECYEALEILFVDICYTEQTGLESVFQGAASQWRSLLIYNITSELNIPQQKQVTQRGSFVVSTWAKSKCSGILFWKNLSIVWKLYLQQSIVLSEKLFEIMILIG